VPELPEVETAQRSLRRAVVGKTVDRAVVLRPAAVRTHTPPAFARAVRGATITDVERRGKSLRFLLGRWTLVFHYMLWGVVRYHPKAPEQETGVSLLLAFTDGSALEFRDLQLSSFHLVRSGRDDGLEAWGIEPLAPTTTLAVFRHALKPRAAIKDALTDQVRIAGIGNLWAHEILFRAHLRPDRKVQALSDAELRVLYRTTREVLRSAVTAGGEPDFQDAFGRRGRYRLEVYNRAGQACPECGTPIRRGRLGGRPSYYCPACQR
jgi:formamidopyrimidine-DNA glycosylase